ncbi:MAG TPA: aldo/keto reductase [Polyangiaceae bacterium]|jgi:predicted oxidoreductase|nr:aldo/keto reductase [Polyangiaceae bacterium]
MLASALAVMTNPSPVGPDLSRLAYGTWRLLRDAELAAPGPLARRLEACADLGITTVDTAEVYGGYEVEEHLGAALRGSPGLRDRLQIVSKCGIYVPVARHPERTVAFYDASGARLVASTEKSLRFLGTDHLDVLLIHRPDWLTPADDTAAGLERLLRDGKILGAGVSNFSAAEFETLQSRLTVPLVTNQIELSLFRMDPVHDGTLQQCERLRVRPMAWSPLGGGRLFREDDAAAVRIRAACVAMAPRYDHAPPEALALAWILALPAAPVVVVGTNKIERIHTAAGAAQIRLDRNDWYRLWEAAQGRPIP